MRISFTLVLLFSASTLFSQIVWDKYQSITNIKSKSVHDLAVEVTKPFEKPEEKVQAIYYWVTHNIKYDYKKFLKFKKKKSSKKRFTKKEIEEQELKEIKNTLSSSKGICQQYSLLFQSMCEHVGIQCDIVTGYAKGPSKLSGLGEKHAWNAVYINNNWHLVDPTFGSGYVNDDDKFVFQFKPSYYFANPDGFKMNHFPEQERWQMTDNPITKDEYKKNPGIGFGFLKYKLDMLYPNEGKISVDKEVPLEISFYAEEVLDQLTIGNVKKATEIEATYSNEGGRYNIILDASELKSGTYVIQNGKVPLFTYRFNVK